MPVRVASSSKAVVLGEKADLHLDLQLVHCLLCHLQMFQCDLAWAWGDAVQWAGKVDELRPAEQVEGCRLVEQN